MADNAFNKAQVDINQAADVADGLAQSGLVKPDAIVKVSPWLRFLALLASVFGSKKV